MSYWVQHDASRGTLEPDHGARPWSGPVARATAARRGLITCLLPLSSMFALVIMAYIMRRHMGDWQPITLPWQIWLSTVLLAASSIAFESARRGAGRGHLTQIRYGLIGAALLAVAFLGCQIWVWTILQGQGLYLGTNPANSFFYLMSALHGLHLIAGLVAWFRIRPVLRGGQDTGTVQMYVQLCAIYWHFLLAVWLVLFGVLLWVS